MAISTQYNVSTMAQGNGVFDAPDVRSKPTSPLPEKNNAPVSTTTTSSVAVSLSSQGLQAAYNTNSTTVTPKSMTPDLAATARQPTPPPPPQGAEPPPPPPQNAATTTYSMSGKTTTYQEDTPKSTFSVTA